MIFIFIYNIYIWYCFRPTDYIIADFGCGDAKLAKSVQQKVHSFDFVAINEHITPCDMAHVPLEKESVNVVVFCLSLMGTNINEYLYEANRVLKKGLVFILFYCFDFLQFSFINF